MSDEQKFKWVVSVDPGAKNNGVCFFKYDKASRKAATKLMDIMTKEELSRFLRSVQTLGEKMPEFQETGRNTHLHIVVENFRVDSNVRNARFQWDEIITARMIGRCEFVAEGMNANCAIQEPGNVLAQGRKWVPEHWKPLPLHIPDDKAAWIHGVYYMLQKRWISTANDVTLVGQTGLF